jgi:asparagine synthase (glutamine-hydrolysing)
MSGISGWLSKETTTISPPTVLANMANALGNGLSETGSLDDRMVCREGLGLCLRPGQLDNGFAVLDSIHVAIDGQFRWRDKSLSDLAASRGHGAALVEAYRKFDVALFDKISGLFTLAIIDTEHNRSLVATDRMGNYPVYYSEPPGGGAVFGTRSKAVLAHPSVSPAINHQGVFNYFYFFMSPAPQTIYQDQKKLLAAQYLLIENGRPTTHFYWKMPYRDVARENVNELHQKTFDQLKSAVARAVEGENVDNVASFLSGGLDSTTVTGLLGDVTNRPAKCFTIGFHEEGYDETAYALISSNHFDAEHHAEYMTPDDMFDAFPKIAACYDEPFGNSSAAAGYFCAMRAKNSGIDVLLAGDGGDELFAGNDRYLSQRIFEHYNNAPSFLTKGLLKPAVFGFPFGDQIGLISKARNYIRLAEMGLPDRLQSWNWMERFPLSNAFKDDYLSSVDPALPFELIREPFFRADTDSDLQRMMHHDLQITLADNDLPKVNRTCELAGIRVKFPFLDDDLVTHSAQVPAELLMAGNDLRHYYKQAFKSYLPPETLSKAKHGFGLPFGNWAHSHEPTRELLRDSLNAFKSRGYMKPSFIDRVIDANQATDDPGEGFALFDIVMFELWLQAN